MALIYKIACDVTNKCYVGQTRQGLKRRIKRHLSNSRNGCNFLLHKAIRKYGWKHFKVEVLEDNIPLEKLNERELYYTEKYKALSPNGYVLVAGGKPRIVSSETRIKISKSMMNRKLSKKHIKNITKNCCKFFGKYNSQSKIVLCYDLNDNFIKEYQSLTDASKDLNLQHSCISLVCHKKQIKTGNFKFRFKND